MNVLLCALRDGLVDINYLTALRDSANTAEWFTVDRPRPVYLPFPGSSALLIIGEGCSAWFERGLDLWAGAGPDMICRLSNEPRNSPWLLQECKAEQTFEVKGSMRRTLTAPPPSWQAKKAAWRSRWFDPHEAEEHVSS
jgi:hypothetical protein